MTSKLTTSGEAERVEQLKPRVGYSAAAILQRKWHDLEACTTAQRTQLYGQIIFT